MSDVPYRPLSVRSNPQAIEEYEALHEGITDWMAKPIQNWVTSVLITRDHEYLSAIFQILRLKMEGHYNEAYYVGVLAEKVVSNDPIALDVLDLCVRLTGGSYEGERHRSKLDTILSLSRSAWKVGQNGAGDWELQHRIDPETAERAEHLMQLDDSPSEHLRRAWSAVYGRRPDPNDGYDYAVKAVEAVARPVISPKNRTATSTIMINDMVAKPEKWRFILDRRDKAEVDVEVVIEMWRTLAKSQRDRHGTDLELPAEQDMSPEEAEAALHLALTLVHWFRTGAIARVAD